MIKTVTYNMDLGLKAQGKITATPLEDIKLAKVRGRKDMGRGRSLWVIDTIKVNPKVVRTFALEYAVNFSPVEILDQFLWNLVWLVSHSRLNACPTQPGDDIRVAGTATRLETNDL
ncbi:MAG: hypothetical protein HA492_03960 [Candidatus Verstraetearchaeota archaeon]|nr:hypothetical protein [Candidatus Verstraetearchaeota archaeon]